MTKQTTLFFYKKEGEKTEGERPALFAIESYLTGIMTSLDSSGSSGQVPQVLEWVCVSLRRGGGFGMGVPQGMARNGKSADQWAQSPTESP